MRQLVVLLLLLSASVAAQPTAEGSPLWIAERLFDPAGFPEIEHYAASAENVPTDSLGQLVSYGTRIEPGTRVVVEPVGQDSASAVIAVRLSKSGDTADVYLHFEHKAQGWQLHSLRSLWLPGFYVGVVQALETWDAAQASPDPEAAFWDTLDPGVAETMELSPGAVGADELARLDSMLVELPNMRLTLGSDSTLRAHFRANRAGFDQIASTYQADSTLRYVRVGEASALSDRLRRLHLRGANRDPVYGETVWLHVGGFIDNEVGYLYVPDGETPPEMSPSRYIYVEPLGDGWYLYKTT